MQLKLLLIKFGTMVFYILETKILDEKKPQQKSITLSSLLKLNPTQVKYENLTHEIAKLDNKTQD